MTATIYDGDPGQTRPAYQSANTIYYGDPDIGKTRTMYDTNGVAQQVKDTMVSNRRAQGWVDSLPTVAVTGTCIAGGVLESAIVTGGETLIFTLSVGVWSANVPANNKPSYLSDAEQWDDEVHPLAEDYARTSDMVLTLTTPAAAGYSISEDEVVTFGLQSRMVTINGVMWPQGGPDLVCSPASFTITNEA